MSIVFVFTSMLLAYMLETTQTSPSRRSVFSAPVLSSTEENSMESWFLSGSHAQNYEAGIDPTTPYQGKSSGYIQSIGEECKGFGTLTQMFKADAYRNKRMRFAAVVKSEPHEVEWHVIIHLDPYGPRRKRPRNVLVQLVLAFEEVADGTHD
jgi:hypothetical protein